MKPSIETLMALKHVDEAERLIAHQVERVFLLRSAHLNADEAENKLAELRSRLASHRARLSRTSSGFKPRRQTEKSVQEGFEVGGPRWKIGWAGTLDNARANN